MKPFPPSLFVASREQNIKNGYGSICLLQEEKRRDIRRKSLERQGCGAKTAPFSFLKIILDTVLSEKYNYQACFKRHICGRGGTGRRARLRGVWVTPYEFKSRRPHHHSGLSPKSEIALFICFRAGLAPDGICHYILIIHLINYIICTNCT